METVNYVFVEQYVHERLSEQANAQMAHNHFQADFTKLSRCYF